MKCSLSATARCGRPRPGDLAPHPHVRVLGALFTVALQRRLGCACKCTHHSCLPCVAVSCRGCALPCRGCASRSCRMQCRKSGRARVRLRMPCRMPCDLACSVACSVACCVLYAMRRGQAVQYANQQKYRSARARTDHLQHGCPSARHRPQLWWWVDVAGKASPKCTLSKTAVRFSALYRPL